MAKDATAPKHERSGRERATIRWENSIIYNDLLFLIDDSSMPRFVGSMKGTLAKYMPNNAKRWKTHVDRK